MTNKITLRFAESGVVSGGLYWFQPDTAIRIIERAKETGTPLLGFRAAALRSAGMQESLEHSWNYVRAKPPIKNAHEHAIGFISERRDSGLSFRILLPELDGFRASHSQSTEAKGGTRIGKHW
jgi:hypothetical protein